MFHRVICKCSNVYVPTSGDTVEDKYVYAGIIEDFVARLLLTKA